MLFLGSYFLPAQLEAPLFFSGNVNGFFLVSVARRSRRLGAPADLLGTTNLAPPTSPSPSNHPSSSAELREVKSDGRRLDVLSDTSAELREAESPCSPSQLPRLSVTSATEEIERREWESPDLGEEAALVTGEESSRRTRGASR
ncbi:hypothetical protein TIFTF001_004992 [Ficus carica]|uniref:Uncharacterized protein n=1 Tax=Ficus carica TaxID=3494 RepID=A0AA88CY24_FICCA|nr:hypothetical protein TIFTF001_004992 [Ficus carica]